MYSFSVLCTRCLLTASGYGCTNMLCWSEADSYSSRRTTLAGVGIMKGLDSDTSTYGLRCSMLQSMRDKCPKTEDYSFSFFNSDVSTT